MGNSFSVSGSVRMASSKRSLVIELVNLYGKHYVSVEDVLAVATGKKKNATIWIPKSSPRPKYYRRK